MYTYGYLFYIPVNLMLILVFGIKGILQERKKGYYFFVFILGIYLNFLIDKAFFPIFTDGAAYYTSLADHVNLDVTSLFGYTLYQIIGNLALTFPMGILLAFVMDCRNSVRTGCSVLLSVLIEFVQLLMIISLHLTDVCFDVNDILLNTAGCLCGNAVFYIFCRMDACLQGQGCSDTVIGYFHQVCRKCAGVS